MPKKERDKDYTGQPTAEQRSSYALRGRIGAYRLHALHDAHKTTKAAIAGARTALDAKLLTEIDPDGKLPERERAKRLEYARKAHFSALALKRHRKK